MRIIILATFTATLTGCGSIPFFSKDDTPLTPVQRVGVGKSKYTGYEAAIYQRGRSQGWSDGFDGAKNDYKAHAHRYSEFNATEFKEGYKAGYKAGKEAAKE